MSFSESLENMVQYFLLLANFEKKIEIVKHLFIEFKDFDPYILFLYISKSKEVLKLEDISQLLDQHEVTHTLQELQIIYRLPGKTLNFEIFLNFTLPSTFHALRHFKTNTFMQNDNSNSLVSQEIVFVKLNQLELELNRKTDSIKQLIPQNHHLQIFNHIDFQKDNEINHYNLKVFLNSFGFQVTNDDLLNILRRILQDEEQIDLNHFIMIFEGYRNQRQQKRQSISFSESKHFKSVERPAAKSIDKTSINVTIVTAKINKQTRPNRAYDLRMLHHSKKNTSSKENISLSIQKKPSLKEKKKSTHQKEPIVVKEKKEIKNLKDIKTPIYTDQLKEIADVLERLDQQQCDLPLQRDSSNLIQQKLENKMVKCEIKIENKDNDVQPFSVYLQGLLQSLEKVYLSQKALIQKDETININIYYEEYRKLGSLNQLIQEQISLKDEEKLFKFWDCEEGITKSLTLAQFKRIFLPFDYRSNNGNDQISQDILQLMKNIVKITIQESYNNYQQKLMFFRSKKYSLIHLFDLLDDQHEGFLKVSNIYDILNGNFQQRKIEFLLRKFNYEDPEKISFKEFLRELTP